MRKLVVACIGLGAVAFAGLWHARISAAGDSPPVPAPLVETLLSTGLEGVEGTEVIVSRVVIPPGTSLPGHWHPGEEFAYVLEGSTILRRDGRADAVVSKGEVVKIAPKEIHTVTTAYEGATVLVFRVHEHGQPERVLVE